MVKPKNKHRNGGEAPSSHLVEDPMLAEALARPGKSSRGSKTRPSFPISVKHAEIDEQCSEGDTSEKQSEAASKTLGTEDTFSTQGVRLNAQEKTWNVQCEPSVAGDDRAMRKETQEVIKKPFASLFAKNRLPSNGSKLEYFNLEEGPIKLKRGRHPRLGLPLVEMPSWLFSRKIPREAGPKPISCLMESVPLNSVPPKKEAISTFPVWVHLRNDPLTMWNPMVFGKICSRIGRPIHMDRVVGHIKENCKKKQNNPTKAAGKAAVSSTESTEQVPPEGEGKTPIPNKAEQLTEKSSEQGDVTKIPGAVGQSATSGTDEWEKSLQGWILKQSKHSKAKSGVTAEGNGPGPSNALSSIPKIPKIEDSRVHPSAGGGSRAHTAAQSNN
ncbi:hypothetical protein Acr_00g0092000 [Actinidia rufa]|uniref:DUF4283 domain-containing protein n=1 Tax=Actinidia rufa TaxID=165716 RepID=A0A7J0DXD2_9ERIC|nr:hypothetical protein Acr_00g0092000 [Actinidia rufa]